MSTTLNNHSIRPATMGDLEAVLTVFNAYSMEYIGKPVLEENELQGEWKMPVFDLETDSRIVLTPSGRLVGYANVWDSAPHVRCYAQVRVHPECVDPSVGEYLRQWVEERARQAIPQAPQDVRVMLFQSVYSANKDGQALLRQRGYRMVRHFLNMAIEMDAPPPAPVVPEGIHIRPFVRDQEAHALVHAIRGAFKDHWGYVETSFEEDYAEWVSWMDDDPSFKELLWFLAMDGEEIAGFSLSYDIVGEGPDVGVIEQLGVLRPWRRRGLALALLQHTFGELYRRDKSTVTLGVDAQSLTGATRLYEKAGMHVRHQRDRYEKELRPGKDLSTQSVKD